MLASGRDGSGRAIGPGDGTRVARGGPGPAASRAFAWMALLMVPLLQLLVLTPKAQAVPDVDILEAKFGFHGALVPERWSPIRLTIGSAKDSFSGTLVVSYAQDATQSARVTLPVATTPGVATTVEVVVCVPATVERIRFEFTDPDTLDFRQIDYSLNAFSQSGNPNLRDLPPPDATARTIVGVERLASLDSAAKGRDAGVNFEAPDVSRSIWSSVAHAPLEPADLPLMWGAYDAADVVVVREDLGLGPSNRVDPRALAALRAWVRAGGRLVVVLQPEGEGYLRFLDGVALLEAPLSSPLVPPERLANVLGSRRNSREGFSLQEAEECEQGQRPDWDPWSIGAYGLGVEPGESFAPASTLSARTLRLTDLGVSRGWRVDYLVPPASEGPPRTDPAPTAPARTGLVASGPVGLGIVMVVGFDPGKASNVVSDAASTRVWRDILTPMLLRSYGRSDGNANRIGMRYTGLGSGSSPQAQDALHNTLTTITKVPRLGHGVFIAIAVVVVMLALLVGPVDSILLRRLQLRQHSWLSAIIWIGLACLLAAKAPSLVRSGDNAGFRLSVYDAIAAEDGSIRHASREGLLSLFPGRSELMQLEEPADGAMHRGVSLAAGSRRSEYVGGVLNLAQGVPRDGELRALPPVASSLRQWSLRATLDEAPAAARELPLNVRLEPNGERWRLSVAGLRDGTRVTSAFAEVSGRRAIHLTRIGDEPGAFEGRTLSSIELAWLRDTQRQRSSSSYGWRGGGPFSHDDPGEALALPLASTRRDAIARYLDTGAWACIHLAISDWTTPVVPHSPAGEWKLSSGAVVRVLVPIPAGSVDSFPWPDGAAPGTAPAGSPLEPPSTPPAPAEPAAETPADQPLDASSAPPTPGAATP